MLDDKTRMRTCALAGTVAAIVAGVVACTAPAIPDDTLGPLGGYPTRTTKGADAGSSSGEGSSRGRSQPPPPEEAPPPVVIVEAGAPDADAALPPVDSGTPPPTGPVCSDKTSAGACFQCCEQQHPAGLRPWNQYFGQCACESPAICANACATTYCSGIAPAIGSACDNCLASATTCFQQADQRCLADATCAPLVQCDRAAKCASKP